MKSLRGVYVIEELNINVAMEAPGINGNKRRVADFCAEKVLQIGNTYSKMRNIDKYNKVARGGMGN